MLDRRTDGWTGLAVVAGSLNFVLIVRLDVPAIRNQPMIGAIETD